MPSYKYPPDSAIDALRNNSKLLAIQIYKEEYHVDLKEAKDAINYFESHRANFIKEDESSNTDKIDRNKKDTPFSIFKREASYLFPYHNDDDCLIYPKISEAKLSEFRSNFSISREEKILLCRDTSFWSSADQGIVITDAGIYGINDNGASDSKWFLDWANISDVSYQELSIHFKYGGDDVNLPVYCFIKTDRDYIKHDIGIRLAKTLRKMANSVDVEDPFEDNNKAYQKLIDAEKWSDAESLLHNLINEDDGTYKSYWHLLLAVVYEQTHRPEKAIQSCSDGLAFCEEGSSMYIYLRSARRDLQEPFALDDQRNDYLEHIEQVRKDCLYVAQNATDERDDDERLLKDDAKKAFQDIDSRFCKCLLLLPYGERKVIMPVKRYSSLDQDHIVVADINSLPENIDFPIGHPLANHLYVGHPYLAHRYIPIEDYQLELVEDRVREFCQLAQSLGATEISIECLNSNSNDQSNSGGNNISGGVEAKRKGSAQYKSEYSRHMIDSLRNSINLHQTFSPSQVPSLPDNLVWYQNEPSWQRLYNQRMKGGLLSHEERIETSKSQVVDGRELRDIKGEVEGLYAKMNLSFEKTDEQSFQQQENATLAIKIHFAPLEQLTGNNQSQSTENKTAKYSSNEQNYINELMECLADGEIGAGERRFLGKLASKLGISAERASELEASLAAPVLSDDEKDYLEEFKAAAVDGVVSEKERRLLDKLKKMYGISDERAMEIESLK